MKHILIPTDFSECAANAARYAMSLYDGVETRFTLLHVHDFSNLGDQTIEDCEVMLHQAATVFPESHHEVIHIVETALGSGSVVDSILRNATDREVDLIIMGTRSKSRPRWMGGYAEEVVLRAKCPVLIIPDQARYKLPEKLIMPLDPANQPSRHLLEQLMDFLPNSKPWIEIVSVIDNGMSEELVNENIIQWIDQILPYSVNILVSKDIAESILEFGAKEQADMLILFPRRRGLFKHMLQKSISKKVAHLSSLPLLSLVMEK